ncbi:UNVERIFIED_CONTAM: hypothetical protein PYX00_007055 [Menopon gallinae]|uniref:OB domain-containing protein n=1 Tax=Menopon gallinae TaxID=328185 RepID=A0AAW2HHJ6_9NEOP
MRDHTSNEYCDFLWINDLLSLKKESNNEFRATLKRSGEKRNVKISNVVVYGTVVEVKQIGEKGILYSVDDGTGIILCKFNDKAFTEIFDILQTEQGNVMNETFSSQVQNDSQLSYSEDDTIFNDNTLQDEEVMAMKRNKLKALHSIWSDIEDSFSCMTGMLNIGDAVIIQGKLYTYFGTNQIHINIIRLIDTREEILLTKYKLEDGYEPLTSAAVEKDDEVCSVKLIENDRKSGVMTFDHIHHLETVEMTGSKLIASNENSCDKVQTRSRKRKSIVPPQLQGSITFDTFTDLNDSGTSCKIQKFE